MALNEFDIIERFFSFSENTSSKNTAAILQGIGDDAAVIALPNAAQATATSKLLVATDTLIESVHFPKGFSAEHIASRAIGVNLSDFAAMGVRPQWFTLALSLPKKDINWLESFSRSLQLACKHYDIALVGGDTTCGPLSITLTVMAQTQARYLARSGAQLGDDIWVSGSLGKGAAALAVINNSLSTDNVDTAGLQELLRSFNAPKPRIELGCKLVDIASSAIDISDGLYADAGHIAKKSAVQCLIDLSALPIEPMFRESVEHAKRLQWAISGGDDYELLFTASPTQASSIAAIAQSTAVACTKIGSVQHGAGVKLVDSKGGIDLSSIANNLSGYKHF